MRFPIRLPKSQRYYLPGPAPFPIRLKRRLSGRPIPIFPRTVQIQTVTGCNADCVWCPYGATAASSPHGRMTWDLYRKILEQCAEGGARRISPYLMNEPLVDHEIWRRVQVAKEIVPKARITLTTNGSLLDESAVEAILDLGPALHELAVSVQGTEGEAYRETMRGRLTLDGTVANVVALDRAMKARGARRPALTVTMVRTRRIDVAKASGFWGGLGIASRVTPLDNQGGLIQIEPRLAVGTMVENEPCPRPHKQAYVMWNGDVVVCCTDYRRSVPLGSLATATLREVWNGEAAIAVRRAHVDRDRSAMPALCRDCRIDRPS